jgi:hypothetical protein
VQTFSVLDPKTREAFASLSASMQPLLDKCTQISAAVAEAFPTILKGQS